MIAWRQRDVKLFINCLRSGPIVLSKSAMAENGDEREEKKTKKKNKSRGEIGYFIKDSGYSIN